MVVFFQFVDVVNLLQWICRNCISSLVTCYNFIKECQEKSKKIYNFLENINSFIKDNESSCNPMYINVDKEGYIMNYKLTDVTKNIKTFNTSCDDISKYEFHYDTVCNSETNIKKQNIKSYEAIQAKDLISKDESRYKCKICLQTYSRGENVMKHYYRAHAPKKHKCTLCQKKYGTSSMLKDHINSSHSKAVCSHCGKVYNSKSSLKNHEKSHIVQYICPQCGKVYKTHISFKHHVELCGKERILNIEEKFQCDYCGKQYSQKSSLRVHIQFEHGNWKCYICRWCDKKCNSLSKWKEHIVKHTKEKNFGCDICGGTFVTKQSLLYHTRTHTGEKPYVCSYCGKSFLSSSRRSTHIKHHHLPGIEECDVCNKKFKGKAYLLKHHRRHFDPNSRLHNGVE